ncbi:MAG: non-canonical purine NTP pyrophosphatase [Minicystis sp.]
MSQDQYYFSTSSADKVTEAQAVFGPDNPRIRYLCSALTEILDMDLVNVVRAKAAAAYREARLPVIVEHGGLFIEHLSGLPGPLVKPTWVLLHDRICELVPRGAPRDAEARSAVCFCDGRTRRVFEASVKGTLAEEARGCSGFHWDPVFIPVGKDKTFAEMSLEEKLGVSASAKAYAQLRKELGI